MSTYYVDPSQPTNGVGTEASPFKSWADLPTLVAGDNVKTRRGTFMVLPSAYSVSGSGTALNWIVFDTYGEGNKPIVRPIQGGGCLNVVSRNFFRAVEIDFLGDPTWTNQNTYGVRINGGGNDNELVRCKTNYLGVGVYLDGGFSKSRVKLIDHESRYNRSDGLRHFSGAGSYLWSDVQIIGGDFSNNGLALAANGAGIVFFNLDTHTAARLSNIVIRGVRAHDNYQAGIAIGGNGVPWTTYAAAANTTIPTKVFSGVEVSSCDVRRNGRVGITLAFAEPSALMGVKIRKNQVHDNGATSTIGNIWTGACLLPLIELNRCTGARTIGTVIGDGQGIFDDQWNDGATVRWNYIADNVFNAAINPEYSAYGIGIFRARNSTHYGNVIVNCRYGYVIGTTGTQPTVSGCKVFNNTIINCEKIAFSFWAETPAGSFSVRNNLLVGAPRDIEAHSGNAGNQQFSNNAAWNVTMKYTGNNVGAAAVTHLASDPLLAADLHPTLGSPLIGAGSHMGYTRDAAGIQRPNPPSIGAYDVRRATGWVAP